MVVYISVFLMFSYRTPPCVCRFQWCIENYPSTTRLPRRCDKLWHDNYCRALLRDLGLLSEVVGSIWCFVDVPCRKLTYPTWGSWENHRLIMDFSGDMLVPRRIHPGKFNMEPDFFSLKIWWFVNVSSFLRGYFQIPCWFSFGVYFGSTTHPGCQ